MARDSTLLTDEQWKIIAPLLPAPRASRKGGPKPIANRPCFEGILWVLRSGARWKDLPREYPSPSTCWRRLRDWEDQGMARLEKLAKMLEKEHPSAAASLREGLAETFTVNRLGLPVTLRRCLCTTNVIESPHSGVRQRTGRVSRWRDGAMVLRWAATAFLATEKSFRRIMGYQQLWMLEAHLNDPPEAEKIAQQRKVG